MLKVTNGLQEAEPLMQRVVGIYLLFQKRTGHRNTHTVTVVENYLLARELKLKDAEIRRRLDQQPENAGLDSAAFEAIWQEVLAANSAGPFQVTITEVDKGGKVRPLGCALGMSIRATTVKLSPVWSRPSV